MRKISKNIGGALLIVPFFFLILFCCCVEEKANAFDQHATAEHHQELEQSHHSERDHHQHSEETDECLCPKHLIFFSAQSANTDFYPSLSHVLAKSFLVNLRLESTVLLSSLANQSHGPPPQVHLDQDSPP